MKKNTRKIMEETIYFLDRYIEEYDNTHMPNLALLANVIKGVQEIVSSIDYEELYNALAVSIGAEWATELLNKYRR